jgi:hypothetical protein
MQGSALVSGSFTLYGAITPDDDVVTAAAPPSRSMHLVDLVRAYIL